MLNRIRVAFGLTPRVSVNTDPPIGSFEVLGNRCVVRISDPQSIVFKPITVMATIYNEVVRKWVVEYGKNGYLFSFEIDDVITLRHLAIEHVQLHCENLFGLKSRLKMDGASQLLLIREQMGKPRAVLFNLDFSQGGNVLPFLGKGWSRPESSFCWSDGKMATVTVPAKIESNSRYEVTFNCKPYTALPTVTSQSFLVSVNGYPLSFKMDGKEMGFIAKTFGANDLAESDVVEMLFHFPDCVRPCDYTPNKDSRLLAFAFKQITFAKLLVSEREI